jgi:hypothetical protein
VSARTWASAISPTRQLSSMNVDPRIALCGFDDRDPKVLKWWGELTDKDKRDLVRLSNVSKGKMRLLPADYEIADKTSP